MKKEFNFKGAKQGARVSASETKVAISVRLDMDVMVWLKQEAERTAIPYQTLMNSILKQSMRGQDEKLRDEIRKILAEKKRAS